MKYAYCRCSLNETKQDITRQINILKEAGAEKVFYEYEHGDAEHKEQLSLLLDAVKEGDTIMALEVSRFARSTKQLCELIEIVKEKKICLDILGSIKVDCRSGSLDPFTECCLKITGIFAELELNIIRERVKSGMEHARSKGVRIGRPVLKAENIPPVFYRHYPSYINGAMNLSELARVCNLSRNTVYKYLSILQK